MRIFNWGSKKQKPSSPLQKHGIEDMNLLDEISRNPFFHDETLFGEFATTRQFQLSKKLIDMCTYASRDNNSTLSTFAKEVFKGIKDSYDSISRLWQPFISWNKAEQYVEHLHSDTIKCGSISLQYSIALELYFILQQKDAIDYLEKSGYRFIGIDGQNIDAKKDLGLIGSNAISNFVHSFYGRFSTDDKMFVEMIVSIYNQLQKEVSAVEHLRWDCSSIEGLWDNQRNDMSFYPYMPDKVVLEADYYYAHWEELLAPLISNLRTKKATIHLNGILETSYYFSALASMFAKASPALVNFRKLYSYRDMKTNKSVRETIIDSCGEEFAKELSNTLHRLL